MLAQVLKDIFHHLPWLLQVGCRIEGRSRAVIAAPCWPMATFLFPSWACWPGLYHHTGTLAFFFSLVFHENSHLFSICRIEEDRISQVRGVVSFWLHQIFTGEVIRFGNCCCRSFGVVWGRVSLWSCSWPWTCHVAWVGPLQPYCTLPPESWDHRHAPPYAARKVYKAVWSWKDLVAAYKLESWAELAGIWFYLLCIPGFSGKI